MCAMLWTVLLCALGLARGVDIAKCVNGNSTERVVTLTPSTDGVVGRYEVQVCTVADRRWTAWELDLSYYEKDDKCRNTPENGSIHIPGKPHSNYKNNIKFEGNCSYVCLHTTLDMLWSDCYALDNSFLIRTYTRNRNFTYFNIKNNYTYEYFAKNRAVVDVLTHDDDKVTFVFYTGIPFRSYYLDICEIINTTRGGVELGEECQYLSGAACATPSSLELRCGAALAPACYSLHLRLRAPWDAGVLATHARQGSVSHAYCVNSTSPPLVGSRSGAAWAWGAGGACAVCAGAALLLAARARDSRRLRTLVRDKWRAHVRVESTPEPKPTKGYKHILLLYAREGEVGAKFVSALIDMLEEAPGVQVLDIFSPAVVAAAAPAPGAWLRACLQRRDTAVLLLQAPALAALYPHRAAACHVASPLLGRRVQYRAPQFGDSLLHYAVTLVAECRLPDYSKYYIATLSELETEIFPTLVPYRRYPLPGAGALLAAHVTGAAPSPAAEAELARRAAEFAALARDNKDYLMDELRLV